MAHPDPNATIITSFRNEHVKFIRSLSVGKFRREHRAFVAEGLKLAGTAREVDWPIQMVAYDAAAPRGGFLDVILGWARARGARLLAVEAEILGAMTAKDNPQTVVGVFAQRIGTLADVDATPGRTWVALEAVRDPGNLGTIVRTVDAAGAAGVILVGNCCDPYSVEAVRATMGSIFCVPVVKAEAAAFVDWAARWPGSVVGTHLSGATDYRRADYRDPTLLVMGSEGPGLTDSAAAACTDLVKIPMAGRADSLNLAIATALMLYEIRRPALTVEGVSSRA
jgi:RNA methyltransferase, TrmH family